jgi:hypothetical protein
MRTWKKLTLWRPVLVPLVRREGTVTTTTTTTTMTVTAYHAPLVRSEVCMRSTPLRGKGPLSPPYMKIGSIWPAEMPMPPRPPFIMAMMLSPCGATTV